MGVGVSLFVEEGDGAGDEAGEGFAFEEAVAEEGEVDELFDEVLAGGVGFDVLFLGGAGFGDGFFEVGDLFVFFG